MKYCAVHRPAAFSRIGAIWGARPCAGGHGARLYIRTVARRCLTPIRDDAVVEDSVDLWLDAEYRFSDQLRGYLGLRHDRYDFDVAAIEAENSGRARASISSPKASLIYAPAHSVELYASWGEGFRAPNLNELYSPGYGGYYAGNPNLDPERSSSLELGLDMRLGAVDFGVNAYRTRIDDLIAFQGGETSQAINVARAAVDGVELSVERHFEVWHIGANATWQDARDEGSDQPLLRRPQRKAAVQAGYALGNGVSVAGDIAYASQRRDFDGELAAYAVVGVRADWAFADHWHLGARLGNAFDRDYSLASGFATPGRELIVTLRWE
mgnify:CR=1 FL=1